MQFAVGKKRLTGNRPRVRPTDHVPDIDIKSMGEWAWFRFGLTNAQVEMDSAWSVGHVGPTYSLM